MGTDASKPAEHVRQMAAEDAAIGMELVDDDVPEVLEQLRPSRMVRQDARMNHVRVREHHVRPSANRPTRILRRIAVVREDADTRLARALEDRRQLVQLGELVLGERLGGKQVHRSGRRISEDGIQDRHVVAERLA